MPLDIDIRTFTDTISFGITVFDTVDPGRLRATLIINEITCGNKCEPTSDTACNGACPGLATPVLGCADKILACEVISPGCVIDGTILDLHDGNHVGVVNIPAKPHITACQKYSTGTTPGTEVTVCVSGGVSGTFLLQVDLWYETDDRCVMQTVNMMAYRLQYTLTIAGSLPDLSPFSVVYTGILSPESTTTCSPPLLEFKFPCNIFRPIPNSNTPPDCCDCCPPTGATGDCFFRVTL